MKILHILPTLQGGGIANFLFSLAPEQAKLGNKVTILVTDKEFKQYSAEKAEQLKGMGVTVLFLNRKISSKFSTLKTIIGCRRIIRQINPDIINSHTVICHVFASIASLCTHSVHCCTIHSAPESWSSCVKFFNYKKPLIFCSDAALQLRGQVGCPMIAINNGVDTNKIKTSLSVDLRKELAIPENHRIVVLLGSQRPPKNYPFLIEIVKKLQDEAIHFCICGGNNKVEGAGVAYNSGYISTDQFNAYKNIHLLDLRNDVPAILNGSDLYLSCSIREGLPISALEAFFSGIPCVLSPIVQHTNIASGIDECYVPDSFDAENFIISIKSALSCKKTHSEIYQARKQKLEVYKIERCAKEYQNFYDEITQNK